jgi:hypothetical protein
MELATGANAPISTSEIAVSKKFVQGEKWQWFNILIEFLVSRDQGTCKSSDGSQYATL